MSSRSFRLETRSRARDEIKRIMQTVEKVRKWEKIWIETGLSNHLKVYKWVPVREEVKEEPKVESVEEKEETEIKTQSKGETMDSTLPEIQLRKEFPTTALETPQLTSNQLPPDLLLDSETAPASSHPTTVPPSEPPGDGSTAENNGEAASASQEEQQKVDWKMRKEREVTASSAAAAEGTEDSSRPRSPH